MALVGWAVLGGCASAPRAERPDAPPVATAPEPAPNDQLDALAWLQTAEESRRLIEAVFASAARSLDDALADPAWSALGQGPEAAALPPAVIADVDETLIDNSELQGRLLTDGLRANAAVLDAWQRASAARALPGAVEFARRLAERGVVLFYVTNREARSEPATRENLARLGFPIAAAPDVVLCNGERPEWTSDKESRRREVARSHRVLLLLGDDLNDFVSARDASLERRHELAEAARDRWGTSWFVLPNPLYGSWERALVGASPVSLEPAQVRARKRAALRRFDGELPPP